MIYFSVVSDVTKFTTFNIMQEKLTRNETRNSYHLILKGVCCAINPFEHVLIQRGQIITLATHLRTYNLRQKP